jgi:hypothetical protein
MKKQKFLEDKPKGFKAKSDLIFNELASNLIDSKGFKPKEEEKNSYKPCISALDKSAVNQIIHQSKIKNWLDKKGKKAEKPLNIHQVAMDFFKQLDSKKNKEIEGEAFMKLLLSLGVVSDPKVMRKTLCLILKTNDLSKTSIKFQDFMSFFKNDARTDRILKRLNYLAIQERENKVYKVELEDKSFFGKSPVLEKTSNDLLTIGFGLLLKKNKANAQKKLVTIDEHINLINTWWSSLEKNSCNIVHIENLIKLFVSVGIAADRNDSRNLIYSYTGVKPEINFEEFQQIFAKSIFKGSLSNLSKRLSDDSYGSESMSSSSKLTSYQRALLMSGIKCPNSNISVEEGVKAMAAIEKYNLLTNNHQQ